MMENEKITTRILTTQRVRIQTKLGYPQKMDVEEYVQEAVEEKLERDEKSKKR